MKKIALQDDELNIFLNYMGLFENQYKVEGLN